MAVERIGKAVLELLTDSTKFFADLDQAKKEGRAIGQSFDETSKQLRAFSGQATSAGRSLTAGITLPITAAVGGLVALAVQSARTGDNIAKSAREAGLSAKSYQELTFAVGQVAKVTDQELTKAFGKLTIAIGDAANGNKQAVESLKELGFTTQEIASGTITTEEAFGRLSERMQTAGSEAEAMALAGDLLGDRVGPKLAGALRASGDQVDVLRQQFRDLGLGMGDEALAASEKFNDQMDLVTRQLGAVGREIGANVLPVLTEKLMPAISQQAIPMLSQMARAVAGVLEWFLELPRPVQVVAVGFVALAAGIGPVLIIVGKLAAGAASLTALLGTKGVVMASLTAKTGLLRMAMVALTTPITANTVAVGAATVAKGALATTTGLLTGAFGLLRIAILALPWAAAVAGAAAVSAALIKLYAASKERALQAETEGAKQDVINRARSQGAADAISYANAIEFVNAKEAIRIAQFDKTAAAQQKAIEAQRWLIEYQRDAKQITEEQANAQLLALGVELRANDVRRQRISLTDALAASERQIQEEIKATGYTTAELTAALRTNGDGFREWAQKVGLSAETIKYLESRIKSNTVATKEAETAAEKHAKALEKQLQALDKLGLVTKETVSTALNELNELVELAVERHVPLNIALSRLIPLLEDLHQKALRSGVGVKEVADRLQEARAALAAVRAELAQGVPSIGLEPLKELPGTLIDMSEGAIMARIEAYQLAEAYRFFGLTTPNELQRTARAAVLHFETLRASGTATAAQIKKAWEDMRKAIEAATNPLPRATWQKILQPDRDDHPLYQDAHRLGMGAANTLARAIIDGDWKSGIKDLGRQFADFVGSAIASAIPVIGPMLAPIFSALTQKLGGLFGFGSAGRDAVKGFADSMGGFDALREKLLPLGAEGERLWRTLTQGVGRNNPKEAQAAIDAITAALERQEQRTAALRAEMQHLAQAGGSASRALMEFLEANADDPDVQAFRRQQADSGLADMKTFLDKAQILTQGGADALSAALMAGWDGTAVGLKALTPLIEQLRDRLKEAGFEGGAGFEHIAHLAHIASDEVSGPLLEAINAGTSAMAKFYNAGLLTESMFQGLTGEIMAQRAALLELGHDEAQINQLMQADLQRIWQLRKDNNFAVDEATQLLLDEAEAAGLVGDKYRSAMDRAAIAMEKAANAIIRAFGQAGDAVDAFGDRIDQATRPRTVGISYAAGPVPETPGGREADTAALGGLVTATGVQYRGLGGLIKDIFRPKGTDTVPAMLTPGEGVLNLDAMRIIGVDGLRALNSGRVSVAQVSGASDGQAAAPASGETTIVVVSGDGSKDDVLTRIMQVLPRKTRLNDLGFRTSMREALGLAGGGGL